MTAAPQITLLVPCYNAARFLPRLMESVRAQTRSFDAILCYDDGSRDDTVAVAQTLGVEIITGQPNAGVSHARNQLAAAARTEWIHFHDADDLLLPGFLTRLSPLCNDDADVVSCDADWVDEHVRNLMIPWRYDAAELRRAPAAHLLRHSMGLNSSIIRRTTWSQIGGCDERLAMWEDADVHIRLALACARFRHLPEVLTQSLRHSDSFSHDRTRSWLCRLDALKYYAAAPCASDLRAVIAIEAEIAAAHLACAGHRLGALNAIALCRQLGASPPTSDHPAVRLLKPFVPTLTLLRWQHRRRTRPSP